MRDACYGSRTMTDDTRVPEINASEIAAAVGPEEVARREFLRRLGRRAAFVAPVVAAVVLKPSKAFAY